MSPSKRPNFLIILADDLGFSDLGCFGSEISTPNLDSLAATGVRMTDFHTAAACSPTRSMLLSGTDSHIAGVGVMAELKAANLKRWDLPGHEGYLNHRVAALSELLQDGGYHTLLSGKWHLGMKGPNIPSARGFDRSFSLLPGCANHYGWEPQFQSVVPFFQLISPMYVRDGEKVDIPAQAAKDPKHFYSSDYYADTLIDYLDERPKDKPFFAYLPFSAPHWPLQVDKKFRDKYRCMYDDGPEALRQKRLRRLIELGLAAPDVKPHDVIAPEESEWSKLSDEQRALSARAMETYAGMVENMDWNVGRVLDHLRHIGEADNTFVVFLSDNGAEGASLEALPVLGHDIMQVVQQFYDNSLENIGEYNSFVWYGPRWAQASTAPSRLYKMFSTEGGIRVPFILNYPPWTQGRGGMIIDAFATVMDIAPTILDLAHIEHPGKVGSFRGRKIEPMRGKSWSFFFRNVTSGMNAIHGNDDVPTGWELFGRAALRRGKWKIVFMPIPAHGKGEWELFDLSSDPGETNDLATQHPDILRDMLTLWDEYVKETGVAWGEALRPVVYKDMHISDVIGGDPFEDSTAWMPLDRWHVKQQTAAA
ncbi:arylsulfatase [Fistulina hepatica ATCC 64428]|uniref:Arylsulfatase n=1 Tax=Fistulina hepatica ATCC 64428 TaxID=1128425 RepID=A0A0D7AT28_9AGAR|nr:arylsulfatase [Fistulina hepatica ATCC 64428]